MIVPLLGAASLMGVVSIYGIVRLVEQYSLSHLPTIAGLFMLPVRSLYRRMLRAERAELRRERKSVTGCDPRLSVVALAKLFTLGYGIKRMMMLRLVAWVPTRQWRGLAAHKALSCCVSLIDDVADEERPPSVGTRDEFLVHVTRLFLGVERPQTLTRPALAEDLPTVFFIQATRKWLGFDPRSDIQHIWRLFQRSMRIKGQYPTSGQLALAKRADIALFRLGGRMLGMDEATRELYAELEITSVTALDRLEDFISDCLRGYPAFTREELVQAGLDADGILACTSEEQLAMIPGLAQWMIAQADAWQTWWDKDIWPQLLDNVKPHVRPRILRRELVRDWAARTSSPVRVRWAGHLPAQGP